MDLITLTLSKNHLWSALSVAGLAGVTYLTNRYVKNTTLATNQTYYKPFETLQNYNSFNNNSNTSNTSNTSKNLLNINYIFWNGDISSTYILIDLLLQDKIIQPLYVERYTIIKDLEKDKLDNLARDNEKLKDKNGQYKNINNTKFLKSIATLKKSQEYELKQIEILRLMILKQYPEFRNNFLPTTYITTIAKDLEYTSNFYSALLEIKPINSDGIDFVEQVVRFLKYYDKIKDINNNSNNNSNNTNVSRIILGCNKDYKNIELLFNLSKKKVISINNMNILESSDNLISLDMPLIDMDNKTVKFMSVEFFPNDIMFYFMQNRK
jgi:hypothetical protein